MTSGTFFQRSSPVDNGTERPGGAAFAGSAHAEPVGREHLADIGGERGQHIGALQGVASFAPTTRRASFDVLTAEPPKTGIALGILIRHLRSLRPFSDAISSM
jgi:hypothetical protein